MTRPTPPLRAGEMPALITDAAARERRPILLSPPDHDLRRTAAWALAVLSTFAAHGALLWYATREPEIVATKTDEPAAVMIDMSPEVQQAFSQTDEAIGKPMAEAADDPPPPPDPVVPETPPVEEAPVDAIAPLPPKPPERPKIEKPREKPTPRKPLQKPRSVAAKQSSSAPRSDQHAERTTAASAGASNSAAVADWKSEVAAAINRNKRYPGTDGYPTIRMSIAASGAVSGVSLTASSGVSEVDNAAIETVERASPFPPPPAGATTITFRMNFHHR